MRTTVKARNFELGTRLRGQVLRKLERLSRVAHPDAQATVELIANASRSAAESQVAEVTLLNNGAVLRSAASGPTSIAALDTLLDRLERQVARARERPRALRDRRPQDSGVASAVVADAPTPAIVKIKRFHMTPMFEEDAIVRMTELGHAFFVFLNAETKRVGVVYRRTDGRYGLIDPVLNDAGRRD